MNTTRFIHNDACNSSVFIFLAMIAYCVNKHNVKKLFMTLVEDGEEDSSMGVGEGRWAVMCGLQWGFIAREGHQAQLEYKDK